MRNASHVHRTEETVPFGGTDLIVRKTSGRPLLVLHEELGIVDTFERAPGSRPLGAGGAPDPVAWPERLAS